MLFQGSRTSLLRAPCFLIAVRSSSHIPTGRFWRSEIDFTLERILLIFILDAYADAYARASMSAAKAEFKTTNLPPGPRGASWYTLLKD
jgi:hypothetical protein